MTKILKILCNSLGITEDSLPNKKNFLYNKGNKERLIEPIRNDEELTCLVVSQYTQLERVGNQYSGLCPFHQDTNPSFKVGFVEKKHSYKFHCLGCGKRGDLFDLIEKLDGIGFYDAVPILWAIRMKLDPQVKLPVLKSQQKKMGSNSILRHIKGQAHAVTLKSHTKSSNSPYLASKTLPEGEIKERRLNTCRFITEFCHKHLLSNDPDAQKALEYLKEERGLTEEFIRAQKIGFYQKKAMFIGDMLDTGAYSKTMVNHVLLDSFDGYVLFPIRDPETGDVVSFQARLVVEDGQKPKYITKNNECYTKSENLYLLDSAIEAIQDKGHILIVEGTLDALHMHQGGAVNTVALLGRAISDKQIELIKNYTKGKHYTKGVLDVCLFFDNDQAGREASRDIKKKLEEAGLFVMAIKLLGPWKDQADWLKYLNNKRNLNNYSNIKINKQNEGGLTYQKTNNSYDNKRLIEYIASRTLPPFFYSQIKSAQKEPNFNKHKKLIDDTIQKYFKEDCDNDTSTASEQYTNDYIPRNELGISEPQQGVQPHH